MAKTEVLVMIDFTFLCFVRRKLLPLSAVNLLIFDECHHAAGNHPMKEIMECYQELKSKSSKLQLPRIVGLTASVFIGNVSKRELPYRVKLLEDVLDAKLVAPRDAKSVACYCTQPTEEVISYVSNQLFENQKTALAWLEALIREIMKLGQRSALLRRVQDIIEVTIELGDWCCALMIEYEIQQCTIYQHLLPINVKTLLLQRYCEILSFLRGQPTQMCRASSKVQCLLDKLREANFGSCGIIFVATRNKAKLLCALLQKAAEEDPKLNFLVPLHVTGHGYAKGPELTLGNADLYQRHRDVSLNMFRNGECNFLVSTNFIEEGINVQHCNLIVRFDLPENYRSYVQSRGRARALSSKYVMMTEKSHLVLFNRQLTLYKDIESSLQELCKSRQPPTDVFLNQTELDMKLPSDSETIPKPTDEGDQIAEDYDPAEICVHFSFTLKEKGQVLTPQFQYWYRKVGEIRAELRLPKNACMNQVVQGEWEKTKALADQSAILALCRVLSKISLQKPNTKLVGKGLNESTDTAKSSKHSVQDKANNIEQVTDQLMASTSDDTAQITVVSSTVNMDDTHHGAEKTEKSTRPFTPRPSIGTREAQDSEAPDVTARRPDDPDATLVFDEVNNLEGTVHRNAIVKDGMASGVVCKKENLSISKDQNYHLKGEMNENEPIIKKEPEDEDIFMLKSLVEKGDIICVDLSDSMDVDLFSSDEEAEMDLNSVFATLGCNKGPVTVEDGSPSILSSDNQKLGITSNDFPGNSDVLIKKGIGDEHNSFDELKHHPSTSKHPDLSRKDGKGNRGGINKKGKYKLPEVIKYSTSNPGDIIEEEEYSPFDELINSSSIITSNLPEDPNTDMKKKGDYSSITCDKLLRSSTPKREIGIDGVDHEERLSNAFDKFMHSNTPTLETSAHMVKNNNAPSCAIDKVVPSSTPKLEFGADVVDNEERLSNAFDELVRSSTPAPKTSSPMVKKNNARTLSSASDNLVRSSMPKPKTSAGVVSHEERLSSAFDKFLKEDTSNETLAESKKDNDLNCTFDKLLKGDLSDEEELPESPDVEMIEKESDTNSTFDEVLKSPSTRPTLPEDDIKIENIEDSPKIVDYSASEETIEDSPKKVDYSASEETNSDGPSTRPIIQEDDIKIETIEDSPTIVDYSASEETNSDDDDVHILYDKWENKMEKEMRAMPRNAGSEATDICVVNEVNNVCVVNEVNNICIINEDNDIKVICEKQEILSSEVEVCGTADGIVCLSPGGEINNSVEESISPEIPVAVEFLNRPTSIGTDALPAGGEAKPSVKKRASLEKTVGSKTSTKTFQTIVEIDTGTSTEISGKGIALKTKDSAVMLSPELLTLDGRDAPKGTTSETSISEKENIALKLSPESRSLAGIDTSAMEIENRTLKKSPGFVGDETSKENRVLKTSPESRILTETLREAGRDASTGTIDKTVTMKMEDITLLKTPESRALDGDDSPTRNEGENSNLAMENIALKMSSVTPMTSLGRDMTQRTTDITSPTGTEKEALKVSVLSQYFGGTKLIKPNFKVKPSIKINIALKLSPESKSSAKTTSLPGTSDETSNSEKANLAIKMSPGTPTVNKPSMLLTETTDKTNASDKELATIKISPGSRNIAEVDTPTSISKKELMPVKLSPESRNIVKRSKSGKKDSKTSGSRKKTEVNASTSNSEKELMPIKLSPGSRNSENTNILEKKSSKKSLASQFSQNTNSSTSNLEKELKIEKLSPEVRNTSNSDEKGTLIKTSPGSRDTEYNSEKKTKTAKLPPESRNATNSDKKGTHIKMSPGSRNAENTNNSEKKGANTVEADPIISTSGNTDDDSEPPGGSKGSKAATKLWIEELATSPSEAQKRERSEETEDPVEAQKRECSEETEDPASKKIKLELIEESQEYY